MPSTVAAVTFDCRDLDRLIEFWSAVLGYRLVDRGFSLDGTEYAQIKGEAGPPLMFEQVPGGGRRPDKNPVHLDLDPPPGEHAAEVERIIGLGARRADVGLDPRLPWVVLLDPEDNEFCVIDHDRNEPTVNG